MLLFIECFVLCILFTVMVYIMSREPIKTLYNYPEKIQERVKTLDEYKDMIPTRENKLHVKLLASLIIIIIFSLILRYVNGYTSFLEGFLYSYLIWTVINTYDAVVMDIIWFCHDPYFVFKGTEDMTAEYHDYWFHIRQSLIGQIIAIPVCLLTGAIVGFVL